MTNLWAQIQSGLTRPFNTDFLTLLFSVGVVMIAVVFWVFVLEKIEGEV